MGVFKKVVQGDFDRELAPLLEEMNKVGIKTVASCSGHNARPAYIAIDLASLESVFIENGCLALHWNFER